MSKLTKIDKKNICMYYSTTSVTLEMLAKEYNCSSTTISNGIKSAILTRTSIYRNSANH